MRFVVHHTALLHLAGSGALIDDEHELLAPSSSRSRAEYIALTILQADALITLDEEFSTAARDVVALGSVDSITQ